MRALNSPEIARALSRISSPVRRCRGPRASRRFDGSALTAPPANFDDCWYVADRRDGAQYRFHVPAATDKFRRQPVEQLGMRRRIPLGAEVAEAADDAVAEHLRPQAIDRHPRGQRMIGPVQPPCQPQPIIRSILRQARQDRRHPTLDFLPRPLKIAADQHLRLPRLRHFLADERHADGVLGFLDLLRQRVDIFVEWPEDLAPFTVNLAKIVSRKVFFCCSSRFPWPLAKHGAPPAPASRCSFP